MKRAGFVALWVVASFATALVGWSAVRVAGDQVSDRPVRPLSADEVAALAPPAPAAPVVETSTSTSTSAPPATVPPRTPPSAPSPTSSSTSTSEATVVSSTPTSRPRAVTSSTQPPPPSSTTTTTRPPPPPTAAAATTTTSTSAPPPAPTTTTTTVAATVTAYQLAGGSVVISVSPGSVSLVSASPQPGYAMEIKASGPGEVRVEFDGERDSKFRARWSGGALDVDIDE